MVDTWTTHTPKVINCLKIMPRANLGSDDAKDQQIIFWVRIWLKSSDDESPLGYSLEGKKHQNGGGHEWYKYPSVPPIFVLLHLLIFPRSSSSLFTKKYTTVVTAFWICLNLPELFWLGSYWQIWVKRTHFCSMYFSPNKAANWGKKNKRDVYNHCSYKLTWNAVCKQNWIS